VPVPAPARYGCFEGPDQLDHHRDNFDQDVSSLGQKLGAGEVKFMADVQDCGALGRRAAAHDIEKIIGAMAA
jgi:hypothetical protein